MKNELKQEYTRRITQANKTQLIVILYEILITYLEESKKAKETEDSPAFLEGIRKAKACVNELMRSLHYEYEMASSLQQLYLYVNRELITAKVNSDAEPLNHILTVIRGLREAYFEVSKQDTSDSIMTNTQTIYAGLTYSRNQLQENLSGETGNRGFLA